MATRTPPRVDTELQRLAADAAARAGVTVRLLESPASAAEVADLFIEIWATTNQHAPMSPDLLCAFSFTGQYVALARSQDGAVLGASAGFLAVDGDDAHLHSHITGVRAEAQGRRIGYALKLHQRAWAAERGLATISWTFDPLVRRNAHFNLTRLGALPVRYLVNAYGEMADGLNAGEPSDRFLVEWPVIAPAARRDPGSGDVVLACGPDGEPVAAPAAGAAVRTAWIPEDIVALRRRQPELARSWRLALREALTAAAADGFAVKAMRGGSYVMERRG